MQIWYQRYFLILSLCLICGVAIGQEGNPFEMEHKKSDGAQWNLEEKIDLPVAEELFDTSSINKGVRETESVEPIDPAFNTDNIEENPFEIGASGIKPIENIKVERKPAVIKKVVVVTDKVKASINQFKIAISILLLIAMALISTLLRHVIVKVFEGFQSDNLLRSYFRSTGRRVSLPNFVLEAFFVVNFAFSCFLLVDHYDLLASSPIYEFLKILMGVSVLVFGKHIVLFVIREVFPIQKEIAEYNFTITLFLSILGLILMPCNLILGFAPAGMANLTLYFIGLVTVLVLGYLAFRGLLIGSKFLGSNRFHFFMYLCSVEIAPLFILFKVVNNYLGS